MPGPLPHAKHHPRENAVQFALNADQIAVQDLVRRFANEKVASRANEIDRLGEYPQDMFDMLKELELFRLPFPEAYGGMGSVLSAAVAAEELCRVCYNTAYVMIAQWGPFGAIHHGGTDEQRLRFLPGLCSGDLRASIAVTEPQNGSDVAGIKSRARAVSGGYLLNGAKIWCTNAAVADFIVVGAKLGDDDSRHAVNLFIVQKGTSGLTIGPKEDKLGARGLPSCPLFFEDVFVPEENRLGGNDGGGFKAVMAGFNEFRPIIGARAVGLAQGAIDHAIQFVTNRYTFGARVSDNQGIRWMLADMAMQTEAARILVYSAAAMVDSGERGEKLAQQAAMAKAFATDVAMKVTTDAVQLFGAAGISNDSPINRYMRDAKVTQIVEGTNQIQRTIISNVMLGRPEKKRA
jgi:alkylation response protein AidB-like acyl-CoA dehydrogenase|nr:MULTISPECIES: acyl-CoA dehydrogenase family protein [Chelativorans]